MSLKQIVNFIKEGSLVHLYDNSGERKTYHLKSIAPTSIKICDVSSPIGGVLDEGEWPWWIKSELKDDLEELTEIPADLLETLPIERYEQKMPGAR